MEPGDEGATGAVPRVSSGHASGNARVRRSIAAMLVVAALAGGAATSVQAGATPSAHASTPTGGAAPGQRAHGAERTGATGVATPSSVPTAPTPTSTAPTAHVTPTTEAPGATDPAAPAPTQASVIAALVAQVEASGILPGSHWSWTIGDTAVQCHITPAPGQGSGCTSWSGGTEVTVFEGPVTLALVAHEIANAETAAFAIPALLDEVSAAAGGSSWSATDAVASCLVAHFLGFQDGAAGPWQCPATLAMSVAARMHDTVVTTQITATCGVTSGASSTLTFAAGSGTLSVTSSAVGSVPQTAPSGASVVVSGIGTFVARDVGGTATLTGVCRA